MVTNSNFQKSILNPSSHKRPISRWQPAYGKIGQYSSNSSNLNVSHMSGSINYQNDNFNSI